MEQQALYLEISASQLKSWLNQGLNVLLVDTLPEDHFKKRHLPRAKNACVYEVIFLQRMEDLVKDHTGRLVLYGSSTASRDAVTAAEKLARAGYRDLCVLEGGLRAWREAGYPLEGEAPEGLDPWPAKESLADGDFQVDREASFIGWTGRNANVGHHGIVRLKNGELSVRAGTVSGTFLVDMDSIVNFNLQDEALRKILIAHLKSDDFFWLEQFPEARFSLTRVQPIANARPGSTNFDVEGRLCLRGIEADIQFQAVVESLGDGGMAAEAHFDLDRTRWGIIYGSGRFFEHLGMHLVYDPISIQVRIVAR
ncbi:MAG TPA: sulfurtransferase [Syntrophobacteraceae bacterium]|jgi:polyisoprenoid-binding protein YceI|nr:sulfurtransferase [Syntrophobacteraceae bacterium]HBZ56634.1 sulfurtransferase [Syntrophobacteraceae bacterium]